MSGNFTDETYDSDYPFFPGITVTETAEIMGLNRMTVLYHIDRGNLRVRKSGRVWLIDVESIRQLARLNGNNLSIMV